MDPDYFKDILEQMFRPENLIKLSPTSVQATRRQDTTAPGSLTVLTSERDGKASECKDLVVILQPFGIYFQAFSSNED